VYEFFALAAQAADTIVTTAPQAADPFVVGGLIALYAAFVVMLAFIGGIIITE
jgi:hypothetical protein